MVVLVSMNNEPCFRNADTSCVKLSTDFSSKPANHSKAEPVRFSAKNRKYPTYFSSSLRCALDIASLKAWIWDLGSEFPEYSWNLIVLNFISEILSEKGVLLVS